MFGKYESEKRRKRYLNNHYINDLIKSAIWDYVGGYTSSVNDYLRADKKWEDVTKYMDMAFDSKYVSNGKIDAYRTVSIDYLLNIHGIKNGNIESFLGKIITNKGYMSCAKQFISPWGNTWYDDECILHIISKLSVKYLDIDKIFDGEELPSGEQKEIILNRNTALKIIDTYMNYDDKFSAEGNLIIECEIINNDNMNKKEMYNRIMEHVSREVKKALFEAKDLEFYFNRFMSSATIEFYTSIGYNATMRIYKSLQKGNYNDFLIYYHFVTDMDEDDIIYKYAESINSTSSAVVKQYLMHNNNDIFNRYLWLAGNLLYEGECGDCGSGDVGGVSIPFSTPMNTLGVGDVVPAGKPAMTGADFANDANNGSGDRAMGTTKTSKKTSKKSRKNKNNLEFFKIATKN